MLTIDHQELYKAVRLYLLGVFPEAGQQIIQSLNNNNPLPENAVVMSVLFERNFDESVTTYNGVDKANVQNSVEVRMQLDFYGKLAQGRARMIAALWKNMYSTESMDVCQPLYIASGPNRMPYINDSNQYEDRYMLDLALQYNPSVQHAQDFVTDTEISIKPVI